MSTSLDTLEPRAPWAQFDAIRKVPRPSKNEGAVVKHVLDWAARCGLDASTDEAGSVLVRVPATKGHEKAPMVVIQGHLDMVCEKHADVEINFDEDPIDAFVDGEWVRARGTTLGADNGIGVAFAMAAAEDASVVHGPLELLFTIDEETGMTGAMGLKPDFLSGHTLINLDSEQEGTLYVGCAGGANAHLSIPTTRVAADSALARFELRLTGLKGGHSGLDIHTNRGNANKLLAQALRVARDQLGGAVQIESVTGGDKPNAIARDAQAIVWLAADQADALRKVLATVLAGQREHFGAIAPDLAIELVPAEAADGAKLLDPASADRVVDLVLALPDGVGSMSRDLPGLVETSSNLARVRTEGETAEIVMSSRSAVAPALAAQRDQIRACCSLAGATAELRDGYPGWPPNMASPLLATAKEVYRATFDAEPEITAIHAGLECGLIGDRFENMDMLSFGPTIEGAHSPDERVKISAVAHCWKLFVALLARLAA